MWMVSLYPAEFLRRHNCYDAIFPTMCPTFFIFNIKALKRLILVEIWMFSSYRPSLRSWQAYLDIGLCGHIWLSKFGNCGCNLDFEEGLSYQAFRSNEQGGHIWHAECRNHGYNMCIVDPYKRQEFLYLSTNRISSSTKLKIIISRSLTRQQCPAEPLNDCPLSQQGGAFVKGRWPHWNLSKYVLQVCFGCIVVAAATVQ